MDSSPERTFDSVYSSTDCYYGLDVRPEFCDYFDQRDISGLAALDLGCGEGRYSLYLASKGCHVTSVDCSRAGLSKLEKMAAEESLPIVTCKQDVAEFDFPAAAFDIIVCATILDHLEGELRRRTIRAVRSALKPGGVLYANVFTVSDPGCKGARGGGSRAGGGRGGGSRAAAASGVSDTAECIAHYFGREELKTVFADLSVITYYETVEPDHSHGRPHYHGWACLLAQKPGAY